MGKQTRCSYCGKTFSSSSALQQHTEAVHDDELFLRKWTTTGIVLGILIIVGSVLYWFVIPWASAPSLPGMGDHWHARYEFNICGETLSSFPYSQGDIHTHGKGKIHIHPHSKSTTGKAMNLKNFLESLGGELSDSRLVLPGGKVYEDGMKCPNGKKGTLRVYVNGERISSPTRYVPQDHDYIRFEFGPPNKN